MTGPAQEPRPSRPQCTASRRLSEARVRCQRVAGHTGRHENIDAPDGRMLAWWAPVATGPA